MHEELLLFKNVHGLFKIPFVDKILIASFNKDGLSVVLRQPASEGRPELPGGRQGRDQVGLQGGHQGVLQ